MVMNTNAAVYKASDINWCIFQSLVPILHFQTSGINISHYYNVSIETQNRRKKATAEAATQNVAYVNTANHEEAEENVYDVEEPVQYSAVKKIVEEGMVIVDNDLYGDSWRLKHPDNAG